MDATIALSSEPGSTSLENALIDKRADMVTQNPACPAWTLVVLACFHGARNAAADVLVPRINDAFPWIAAVTHEDPYGFWAGT
jgi:hypothetical protein